MIDELPFLRFPTLFKNRSQVRDDLVSLTIVQRQDLLQADGDLWDVFHDVGALLFGVRFAALLADVGCYLSSALLKA